MGNYGRGWEDGYCPTAGSMGRAEGDMNEFQRMIADRPQKLSDMTWVEYMAKSSGAMNKKAFYKWRTQRREERGLSDMPEERE